MAIKTISVGDKVTYYCFTDATYKVGTVTAVDVPVYWKTGAPKGIQINGSLTRLASDVA